MYQYITIEQFIAIKEYQNIEYSIWKIVSEIICSNSNVYRAIKLLAMRLSSIETYFRNWK